MTWTDPVLKQLRVLEDAPELPSVLQRAAKGDCHNLSVEDAGHNRWSLSTPDGRCTFPIIHEDTRDAIYAAGKQIAKKIAKVVLESDTRKLIGGGASLQQAHLIEGHELMWEMLDAMVREGWVQEPSVLATGAGTTTALTPLLLVKVQNQ